jgi:hypothetical protein
MIKKLSNKNGKDLNETPKSRFREEDYKLLPLPIGSERRRRRKEPLTVSLRCGRD